MAICREFYFPSSDGSSRIHAAEWTPESGEIIGVLQIAHGVAEYGMRYAPFAEFMTEHGFAVVANDHLGHGLSAEKDADTLYFGPRDGWKHVVDDMYAQRKSTQRNQIVQHPIPLTIHDVGTQQHDVAGLCICKHLTAEQIRIGILQPARKRKEHRRQEGL